MASTLKPSLKRPLPVPIPAKMSREEFLKTLTPMRPSTKEKESFKFGGMSRAEHEAEMLEAELLAAAAGEYKSISERYPTKPKKAKVKSVKTTIKKKPLEGGLDKNSLVKLYFKLQEDVDIPQENLTELRKFSVEELREKIGDLIFAFPKLEKYMDDTIAELLESKEEKRAEKEEKRAEKEKAKAKEKKQKLSCEKHAVKQYTNEIYPLAIKLLTEQKAPFFLPVKVQQWTIDPETKEEKKLGKPFVEKYTFRLSTIPTSKEMKLEIMELVGPTPRAPEGWENKSVLDLKRTVVSLQSVATLEERKVKGKNIMECTVTFHAQFEPKVTEKTEKYYSAEIDVHWEELRDDLRIALGLSPIV